MATVIVVRKIILNNILFNINTYGFLGTLVIVHVYCQGLNW